MEITKKVRLSGRLECICGMVTAGFPAVDVGCDHGFVSIYLVQNGICPRVLAMDVRKGPLSMAESHIEEYGLGDYIETRLSDGLKNYSPGEAEVLICAGMGGMLMKRILEEAGRKLSGFREMILQPQSDLYEFRKFLRESGFWVIEEKIILEDGKYYFPMKVMHESAGVVRSGAQNPQNGREMPQSDNWLTDRQKTLENKSEADAELLTDLADRFGGGLLKRKAPLLYGYLAEKLAEEKAAEEKIQLALAKRDSANARKGLEETRQEIFFLEEAVRLYGGDNVYINDQR